VGVGDFCEANTARNTVRSQPPYVRGGIIMAGVFGFSNFTLMAARGDTGAAQMEFMELVGTRDFSRYDEPDDPERCHARIEQSMRTRVPDGHLTEVYIDDGDHYQWGAYGYQFPFKTARIWQQEQIRAGVEAMDLWLMDIVAR